MNDTQFPAPNFHPDIDANTARALTSLAKRCDNGMRAMSKRLPIEPHRACMQWAALAYASLPPHSSALALLQAGSASWRFAADEDTDEATHFSYLFSDRAQTEELMGEALPEMHAWLVATINGKQLIVDLSARFQLQARDEMVPGCINWDRTRFPVYDVFPIAAFKSRSIFAHYAASPDAMRVACLRLREWFDLAKVSPPVGLSTHMHDMSKCTKHNTSPVRIHAQG